MAAVCSRQEDTRKQMVTQDMLKIVIAGLQDESAAVREAAAICTRNMSRSVRTLRMQLVNADLAANIVALITDSEGDVQRAATAAICNLCLGHSPMQNMLREQGLLPKLRTTLDSEVEGVRSNVLCALKV